jgi:hypothetical protein
MSNFTYDEFHAFVMLYAANADSHIDPQEEILISESLPPDRYAAVKAHFLACSDMDALDLILAYRDRYCATPEARDRILADMQRIYHAHEAFSQIERGMHHLFERIFQN